MNPFDYDKAKADFDASVADVRSSLKGLWRAVIASPASVVAFCVLLLAAYGVVWLVLRLLGVV